MITRESERANNVGAHRLAQILICNVEDGFQNLTAA